MFLNSANLVDFAQIRLFIQYLILRERTNLDDGSYSYINPEMQSDLKSVKKPEDPGSRLARRPCDADHAARA